MRPSAAELLFETAATWARRGTCSRLQVGCVIARDNRVLSTGYNGAPSGMPHCFHNDDSACKVAVHAEANSIAYAARNGTALLGTSLYTTHEPCRNCAMLIVNAGIEEVRYWEHYGSGQSGSGVELMTSAGLWVAYRLELTKPLDWVAR